MMYKTPFERKLESGSMAGRIVLKVESRWRKPSVFYPVVVTGRKKFGSTWDIRIAPVNGIGSEVVHSSCLMVNRKSTPREAIKIYKINEKIRRVQCQSQETMRIILRNSWSNARPRVLRVIRERLESMGMLKRNGEPPWTKLKRNQLKAIAEVLVLGKFRIHDADITIPGPVECDETI